MNVGNSGEVVVILALGWLMSGVVEVRVSVLSEGSHRLVEKSTSLLHYITIDKRLDIHFMASIFMSCL